MDHKLHKGEQISEALMEVIEESAICVIIFSKDYASSRWCLDELIKIMECKQKYGSIVIPIFYNVDPSDIRNQSGSYGDAFAKLQKRFKRNKEKVQKWRDALTRATSLSGWDSKNVRPESELIKKIVKDIVRILFRISSCDFEGLIGIHGHVEEIEELMSEAQIVGIWGMGGIGKTTLAKVVFNELKEQFESFSFIENVREQLKGIGLDQLQEKCLKELLKDEDINRYNIRSSFVKNRLQHKKILLVLDDVDNSVQVEDLTNLCNWFGYGSRIIITSRDMQVLKNASAFKTYHVQDMNFQDAFHLFSLKAFKNNVPTDKSYVELSKQVVRYCQGNPLALKILGCFLYGRSKEEWKSGLEKLKEAPHKDIFEVLLLSFDGLDEKQKNLFLDVTCFLENGNELSLDFIRDYHDSYIDIEISILKDRCLISVDDEDYIKMHDLVKKMGQEISKRQLIADFRRPIRLTEHDDVYHFVTNNEGAETIQYISLDMCKSKGIILKANAMEKMYHLKSLKFYKTIKDQPSNVHIFEGLNHLPENLKIFYWEDYPLPCVPLSNCAQNMIEIHMPFNCLQQLWDGDQQFLKLKKMDLFGSKHLISLPDLSHAPNIEYVNVRKCTNLAQIHSSSFLPKLKTLHLPGCKKPRSVNIGSKINGNLGFVAFYKIFDLDMLSLLEVSIKVFLSDDATQTCGFELKAVTKPVTSMVQSLTSLLPFVRKIYFVDITEFENFQKHFQTFLRLRGNVGSAQFESIELHLEPNKLKSSLWSSSARSGHLGIGEKLLREDCSMETMSREQLDMGEKLLREDCSMKIVSLLAGIKLCTSDPTWIPPFYMLTRVPKSINRWSLLTQLRLQKRDINDDEGTSTIPAFSTLKSNCSTLPTVINLKFSRNIFNTSGKYDEFRSIIMDEIHSTEDYLSYVTFRILHNFIGTLSFDFFVFKLKAGW